MQVYDLIMLIVLVGATLIGFRKGFAWQIASLASIFASYFVAVQFRDQLAPRIPYGEPWNRFLAMLLLYLGTSLAIWMAFRLVSGFIDRAKLTEFDHQLGAILGAAKGAVLCVIITLFAVSLLGEEQRATVIYSKSGHYIAKLLNQSHSMIPDEIHQVLDPYLHRLDEKWEPDATEGEDGSPEQDETPDRLGPNIWPFDSQARREGSNRRNDGGQPRDGQAGQSTEELNRTSNTSTGLPRNQPAEDPFSGQPYPRRADVEPSDWR